MAYCRVSALPQMAELTDAETYEIIGEGMKVLVPEVKRNLNSVIKGTSEANFSKSEKANLAENIVTKKSVYKRKKCLVLSFKGNVYRKSKAEGKESRKVRRDEVAAVLEYGKDGQTPTHFLRDSLNNKQNEINTVMKRKFKEIVEQRRK